MEQFGGEYVLELRNIVKLFPGVRALDGMSLKVKPGKVHVIAGENGAGKSTMMKVISGEYVPEEGEVIYKGQKLGKRSIMETINMGISMIHQEMNPIREMTIAENIFLGREPQKIRGFIDYSKMNAATNKLLKELNIPYKATQKLATISIAGQQQIEIAKAISTNASVIIMDEPTSAISDAEIAVLFKQIHSLKDKGVAILYITHKMDEIKQIADEITIIRDGSYVASGEISKFSEDDIISLMVGRKISNIFPKSNGNIGDVVLEVKNLCSKGVFSNISFQVRAGEILGFSGLVGAGRSEVMRSIFGLDPYDSGEIILNGRELKIKCTEDAIKNGIAMASEDRRADGIIPVRSVRENISLAFIRQFRRRSGLINKEREKEAITKSIDEFNIKISDPEQEIRTLSGGNQQKAILARWLLGDIKVLILDEPTRGIDVGSKAEIHKLMSDYANKGIAVIMISSELPEIIGMSDRVLVMREGKVSGILSREEVTSEKIMKLST